MGQEVMLAARMLEAESINDEVCASYPFQVLYLGCHRYNTLYTMTYIPTPCALRDILSSSVLSCQCALTPLAVWLVEGARQIYYIPVALALVGYSMSF